MVENVIAALLSNVIKCSVLPPPYIDVGQNLMDCVYLVCIRKHEDHKFLQHISGVDSKEVFQFVDRHESADLKGKGRANINLTD